jgi:hypothetical protein
VYSGIHVRGGRLLKDTIVSPGWIPSNAARRMTAAAHRSSAGRKKDAQLLPFVRKKL